MADTTARDVLFMIGVGLQQGVIKSPDLEMMYSDGPKRVQLIDLVAQALQTRAALTPPSAHPALQAVCVYGEKLAAWERLPFGTRAYYAALSDCDHAWEQIAAALGVGGAQHG